MLGKIKFEFLKIILLTISICVCILFVVITIGNKYSNNFNTADWKIATYVVNKGDTLWGISEEYCKDNPYGVSIDEYIQVLKTLNNIDDNIIYINQTINIYCYK